VLSQTPGASVIKIHNFQRFLNPGNHQKLGKTQIVQYSETYVCFSGNPARKQQCRNLGKIIIPKLLVDIISRDIQKCGACPICSIVPEGFIYWGKVHGPFTNVWQVCPCHQVSTSGKWSMHPSQVYKPFATCLNMPPIVTHV
jgi:hypothetical protein